MSVDVKRKITVRRAALGAARSILSTNSAQLREMSVETDPIALRFLPVVERGVLGKSWADFTLQVWDSQSPE